MLLDILKKVKKEFSYVKDCRDDIWWWHRFAIYSLICRWFRAAVLPLDENLCAALLHRRERKKCVLCGGWYIPKSNRAKYCPECAKEEERRKTRERVRRHRAAM